MKVRLGYVANALRLKECSPSKTVTVKQIRKIDDYEDRISRLTTISRRNLENTLRILRANLYDQISVYRFSSKLIPLSTHADFRSWDYLLALRKELAEIGRFVQEKKMRVSLHPDHFTILNSPYPEVLEASLHDLDYHVKMIQGMGLGFETKLVLHVGGKYHNRIQAVDRFKESFALLPQSIKGRIILENDDRSFTAQEVLEICEELHIPMVLDLHHHQILNNEEELTTLLPAIFQTWSDLPPKVHISSPREARNPRYHADYIEVETVIMFLEIAKELQRDFDLMIEAKKKDLALFKLAADLRKKGYSLPTVGEILL